MPLCSSWIHGVSVQLASTDYPVVSPDKNPALYFRGEIAGLRRRNLLQREHMLRNLVKVHSGTAQHRASRFLFNAPAFLKRAIRRDPPVGCLVLRLSLLNAEFTQAASNKLLDELMETTIGENLNVQSVKATSQIGSKQRRRQEEAGHTNAVQSGARRLYRLTFEETTKNFGCEHCGIGGAPHQAKCQ
jgi:hypothetical protein